MSAQGTPFVPPLPSPDSSSSRPTLSPHQAGNTPLWAAQAQAAQAAQFAQFANPYMNTPYMPMSAYLSPPPLAPGSYFAPPVALPGSPPTGPTLTANGFPSDYVGYGLASAAMGTPWVNPATVLPGAASHPQTPWAAAAMPPGLMPPGMPPGAPPGTGYNAFQQPLPGQQPAWGPAAQNPAAWGRVTQTPAWGAGAIPGMGGAMGGVMGGGASAAAAAAAAMMPPTSPTRGASSWRDRYAEREGTDRVGHFAIGPHYGPVLDPFILPIVKAELQLNPLLMPEDEGNDQDYLKWNMLWGSSHCLRSSDPPHRSWTKGRGEPAIWPRLTSLRIVSHVFPWMINVKASDPTSGVTCGDVIDTLDDFLHGMVKREEYDNAPPGKKKDMTFAYHVNRSTAPGVPGGRLGEGMRRLDWLCKETVYGGLIHNDLFIRQEFGGLPATFELKCHMRFQMTEAEIHEQEELERDIERENEQERSRSRATSSRSRATSRTGSSRPSSRAD